MTEQTQIATTAQAIAQFRDYQAELSLQDLAPATLKTYQACLRHFQAWLQERPISPQNATQFLAELRQHGKKPATIRTHYAAIRQLLHHNGMTLKLKLRHPPTLPPYHSTDELKRLIHAIDHTPANKSKHPTRDRLVILTLALTGLRRSELTAIRPQDIQDGYLFIRHGKGAKHRTIPLPPQLAGPINLYITTTSTSSDRPIFPISPTRIYQVVRQHARAAALTNITPHSLRHYFATYLVEQGAPLKAVQQLLGHASINTTAIYQDLTPRHLQATVALFHQDPAIRNLFTTTTKAKDQRRNKCSYQYRNSPADR